MILMASSQAITPAARGSGVGSFRSFRFHKRAVFCKHITSYTFLPRQKKYSCDTFL